MLVVGLSVALTWVQAVWRVEGAAASRVTDVALAVAASDDVRAALASPDPAGVLAEPVERVRRDTGTDFIVVMSPDGVRYTHPNPDLVGGVFVGTIAGAQAGGLVVEQYAGSLGPSTRAVVPILVDGEVRGLVSVGVQRTRVSEQLGAMLPQVLLPGLAATALAGGGAWLVARRVRAETLGLNAVELRRLHDHHDAILHAVREGLVITDARGRVQVVNDEAHRLLGLGPEVVGREVGELGLSEDLAALLTATGQHADVPHAGGGRMLLVSTGEVRRQGRPAGTVTTLRDRTELEALTGQLSATTSLAAALHAQNHEAANRLHTVITLIELGRTEEAVRFATEELRASQRQGDAILAAIEEPAVAALLIGKLSQAAERGVTLAVDPDAHLPAGVLPPREVVTILGNLVDNALDAVAVAPEGEREVVVDARTDADRVILTVSDTGPGLSPGDAARVFERGWSTKGAVGPAGRGIGLSLVKQVVDMLGGTLTVSEPPGATFEVTLPRGAA